MPPQQSHGLLDLFDECFGLGAHGVMTFLKGRQACWTRGENLGENLEALGGSVKSARPCADGLLTHGIALLREIIWRRSAGLEGFDDGATA